VDAVQICARRLADITVGICVAAAIAMAPQVSVLMGVRDAAAFLDEALASVFRQTFADFELIVVDDGSTDETAAILGRLVDSRVRVVRQETARGLAAALNAGLRLARGRWVARFDADDVCEPERLERQVEAMGSTHPGTTVLGTWVRIIDAHGRPIGEMRPPPDAGTLGGLLFLSNSLVHPTVLVERDRLTAAGGYDERFSCAQDYDLWLRLAAVGCRMDVLPLHLMRYRQHRATVSRRHPARQERGAVRALQRAYAVALGRPVDASLIRLVRQAIRYGAASLSADHNRACAELLDGLVTVLSRDTRYRWVDPAPVADLLRRLREALRGHLHANARLFEQRGRLHEAALVYAELAARDHDWLAVYNHASVLQRLGATAAAVNAFEQVTCAHADRALVGGAWFHLAELSLSRGDVEAARRQVAACCALLPDHARAASLLTDQLSDRAAACTN
jgi:glycosyltransferase involved in cell wall biosynthesis